MTSCPLDAQIWLTVQCDQDFTNIGNLRRHVNSAHKKLNFNCAVADCGKVFHRKDVMKKMSESQTKAGNQELFLMISNVN